MELIDVLDERGEKTGKVATREEIHAKGYWHKSVHVWFVNSKNEVLLQLRSMQKDSHPGQWDISVAGHVPAGEDDLSSVIREAEEEIGVSIKPDECELLGVITASSVPRPGFINNELNSVYVIRKDLNVSKLTMQEGEVDELKYIFRLQNLKKWLMQRIKLLCLIQPSLNCCSSILIFE